MLYSVFRTSNLLIAIIPSIAFYRASVQPEYNWGLLIINGQGMTGQYWLLVAFMLFAWSTFLLETWHKRKWYYLFPVILYLSLFITLLIGKINDNSMIFRGDAWDFQFKIGLVTILLSMILLLLVIFWIYKDLKIFKAKNICLSRISRVKLFIICCLSFVILFLFDQGEGGTHSILDSTAVIIVVIQGLLLANANESSFVEESSS